MLKEQGQIVEIKADLAMVQTVSKASCSSCQVNSSCGTGIISKAFGERSFITPISNSIHAQTGDLVEVGIPEDLVIKSSLLVYLLPLAVMFTVTLITTYLLPSLTEPWLIAVGFLGLIGGFLTVRRFGDKLSKNKQLEPVLLRIVSRPIAVKQVETS
ncbi:MAG: SoxR reducing system RseC family protein [Gammaproteobacteria bacterium]|nr:SoxR reducing system RseC family protein [Gammaproteobacteria bacterium]